MGDWDDYCEYDSIVDTIINKVSFVDLLNHYGIEYSNSGFSRGSLKIRCPFEFHSDGQERTPSLNISADSNLFKCFGCNAGGSIIEFVMYLQNMPRNEAIKEIMIISGLKEGVVEEFDVAKRDPDEMVLPYIYKTGVLIRENLRAAPEKDVEKWKIKSIKWFKTLDHYMHDLEDDDWKIVKEYYEKVKAFISRNGGVVKEESDE